MGYFYLLEMVKNAAVNIPVQAFVCNSAFISLGTGPRSGIVGSYGDSVFG